MVFIRKTLPLPQNPKSLFKLVMQIKNNNSSAFQVLLKAYLESKNFILFKYLNNFIEYQNKYKSISQFRWEFFSLIECYIKDEHLNDLENLQKIILGLNFEKFDMLLFDYFSNIFKINLEIYVDFDDDNYKLIKSFYYF